MVTEVNGHQIEEIGGISPGQHEHRRHCLFPCAGREAGDKLSNDALVRGPSDCGDRDGIH